MLCNYRLEIYDEEWIGYGSTSSIVYVLEQAHYCRSYGWEVRIIDVNYSEIIELGVDPEDIIDMILRAKNMQMIGNMRAISKIKCGVERKVDWRNEGF